ncbi:MAG: M28 family peptidase [Hyphomicrobiaceae bacterium]|nr:M28 family peptidase [Hyphomicrobiaceae bacterium]
MSEEQVLAELSIDNVRAHMEHICRQIPSRLAGTENARRAAEFNRDALIRNGLDGYIEEMWGYISYPEPTLLEVLAPKSVAIEAFTASQCTPTLPDGISGELVYLVSGAEHEYEGRDLAGKIVLTETSYHPARYEKVRIAQAKGVIGMVLMNWGGPDNTAVPFGSVKPAWGNPTRETLANEMARIPAIGIARTTGLALKEMCENGTVRVRFRATTDNCWRKLALTVGELKAPGSDDFVILGGHQDSWYGEAATDNAAGNACFVELARVMAKHRDKLKRGLLCGFWTAHEIGTMVGSTWFADTHWERLRDHACAYVQVDQPAIVGTTRWGASSNIQLKTFHQEIEKRLLTDREFYWHQLVKGGDSSFLGLGVPMIYAMGHYTEEELKASALARLGWWHHSIECGLDKVDVADLAVHLKVYGAYVWHLLTLPVLPYEFTSAAEQFVKRLEELKDPGKGVGLESALKRAIAFRDTAKRFDAMTKDWQERYRRDPALPMAAADRINAAMKRVNQIIVPLASTAKGSYGHDPYGYTPQRSMIPLLYDIPEYGKLPEGEKRWILETELLRARNRVMDGMTDARLVLEQVLSEKL